VSPRRSHASTPGGLTKRPGWCTVGQRSTRPAHAWKGACAHASAVRRRC
jgi:hypothetical protein